MNHIGISFFIEKIRSLRINAGVVYDRGVSKGLPHDEITAAIEPIRQVMDDFTRQAVTKDLRGLIYGAKSLQNEANAHMQDAKILVEKEMNTRMFIRKIENEILAEMKRQGVEILVDGDFSVSLVVQDGQSVLTYR